MSWEAIGSLGDALGGIGVVVSLIYLAFQMRHNTRAVRAASFHQVVDSFSAVSLVVAQDPALGSIVMRALRDETLSPDEEERYVFYLLTIVRRAESMHYLGSEGLLDEHTWSGTRNMLLMVLSTAAGRAWWRRAPDVFSPAFRAFVDAELAAADGSAEG